MQGWALDEKAVDICDINMVKDGGIKKGHHVPSAMIGKGDDLAEKMELPGLRQAFWHFKASYLRHRDDRQCAISILTLRPHSLWDVKPAPSSAPVGFVNSSKQRTSQSLDVPSISTWARGERLLQ